MSATTTAQAPPQLLLRPALSSSMVTASRPSSRASRLGTPGKALLLGVLASVAAAACAATGYGVLEGIGSAVYTIAHDTKPSVVAALHARSDVAAMDAEALNDSLLGNGSASGTSAAFQEAMDAARRDMIAAAENITFGDAERKPLDQAMLAALSEYPAALGEIRGLAADSPPWLIHSRVLWSSRILSGWAMPAIDELEQANLRPLEDAFVRFSRGDSLAFAEVLAIMSLLGAAVAAAQVFAFRRLGGTAVTASSLGAACMVAAAVAWVPLEIRAGGALVSEAKTSAFDSVLSLNETKAALDRMNALESLWLLTTKAEGRDAFGREFDGLAAQMMTVQPGQEPRDIIRQLTQARDTECQGNAAYARTQAPVLGGLIGAALKNVSYGCAERTPITEATIAVSDYLGIDRRIRVLEGQGNHAAAVDLSTGSGTNQSNWAFDRAQRGLAQAAEINDQHFVQLSDQAQSILDRMAWVLGLLVGGAAALTCLDLWIRTKDYR